MRKVAVALIVLAILAGGAFFGLDYYSRIEAERRVDAFLLSMQTKQPPLRGAVRFNLFENTLQVDGITLRFSEKEEEDLTLGRLTLFDPKEHADGTVSVEKFIITELTVHSGPFSMSPAHAHFQQTLSGTQTIKAIEGSRLQFKRGFGREFMAALGNFGFEEGQNLSRETVAVLRSGLRLESLLLRGIEADFKGTNKFDDESVYPFTYLLNADRMRLEGIQNGLIASMNSGLMEITVNMEGPPDQPEAKIALDTSIQSFEATGLDPINIWRVYGGPDGSSEALKLMDETKAAGISYKISNPLMATPIVFTIGSMGMSDYRLKAGYGAAINLAVRGDNPIAAMEALQNAFESFHLGRFDVSEISLRATDPGDVSFTLKRFLTEGFSGKGIDKFALTGLSLKSGIEQSIEMAQLEMGPLSYAGLIENFPQFMTNEAWPLGSLPTLDHFSISGVRFKSPEGAFSLEKLLARADGYYQSVATRSSFEMTGLKVPLMQVQGNGQLAAAVMGVETLDLSVRSDYFWDVEGESIELQDFLIAAEGLGRIALDVTISGAGDSILAAMHGNEAALSAEEISKIGLASARLRYEDASLLPRIFERLAEVQGIPVEDVKALYTSQAAAYSQFLEDPQLVEQFRKAFAEFIQNPGTMEITLTPDEPVPFILMEALSKAAPGELARAFGPTIAVNQ
ncbi:MAG: hypothetical protein R3245_03005 [Kiloniellales bacterium]|nr:hypothetical protein [Kiloniellales bacterium]